MKKTDDNPLLASETPDIEQLLKDFQRGGGLVSSSTLRERNDQVRFARWTGQTTDGKKHRKALKAEPFPYENASDSRIFFVDEIIGDLGGALRTAFQRAEIKVEPTEASDIARAANAQKVLQKYRNRMKAELSDEVDLMRSYGLSGGKAVWQIVWDRQIAIKMQPLTMEMVNQQAQAASEMVEQVRAEQQLRPTGEGVMIPPHVEIMMALPTMIMDPLQEKQVIEILQAQAKEIVAQLFERELKGVGDGWLEEYKLTTKRARQCVRELREEGATEIPLPYLCKNGPTVIARKVGEDVFLPPEAANDLQRATSIQVREWLTEAELRENIVTDGWDAKWVEEVLKCKKTSHWLVETPESYDVADIDNIAPTTAIDTESGLYEVLWGYKKYVTEEGVPQIWCTVYSPHYTREANGEKEAYAKHYPQAPATGRYPFRGWKRESYSRRFHDSRGIPEIAGTWQDSVKRHVDMLNDRASLEISPAVVANNRLQLKYYPGPGSITHSMREGDVTQFPPPTGSPELAFQLIELVTAMADNYFGRISDKVHPAKWQGKLQVLVDQFLCAASDMFVQMLQLIQAVADPAELERIAGGEVDFPRTPEEIAGQYDISLHFDVREMDLDFVLKKLDSIVKVVVPLDRSGRLNMDQLVKMILDALDPKFGEMLIQDDQTASQKMFKEVKQAVMDMFLGNEPELVVLDPAAERKLEFLQQIVMGDGKGQGGNKKYQQALGMAQGGQVDENFRELMEKYEQNLNMSVQQLKVNTVTGLTGVKA